MDYCKTRVGVVLRVVFQRYFVEMHLFPKKRKPGQSKEGGFDIEHSPHVIDAIDSNNKTSDPPPPTHTHTQRRIYNPIVHINFN